jgi:hypothetical protein
MWKEIVAKAQELIKLAETLVGKTGPEKRAIVVSGMCEAINIPFVPEWAEGLFEPPLYGVLVDGVVAFWNRVTGHKLEQIMVGEEVAAKVAEAVKADLKAAAVGVEDKGELAGETVDEKFDSLIEKYGVK